MIKLENTEVLGWEHAIRGMRNPMNSWAKSDSWVGCATFEHPHFKGDMCDTCDQECSFNVGPNDYDLMKRLRSSGTDHRKFMRMLTVYVDITAPLYWWKEFDTYKVGTVANSCSTMHKIHAKEFTIDDFSHEHLTDIMSEEIPFYCDAVAVYNNVEMLNVIIGALNSARAMYNFYDQQLQHDLDETAILDDADRQRIVAQKKKMWWQMIQLLPSSYNQKRTVMMNYEVLANIYKSRKAHKLDEWRVGFCDWIKSLPYSELITGEFDLEKKDE